jgi:hypothetical protein
MAKYNIFTGEEIQQEGFVPPFKKMCVNCKFCAVDGSSGCLYTCVNESVMESGKKKILESVPDGFEIEELKLKPMKLKNPTKRCGQHALDEERVQKLVLEMLS